MTTSDPKGPAVTPVAALMALNMLEASLDSSEVAENTLTVHLAKLVETPEAAEHLTDALTGAVLALSAWAAKFAEASGMDLSAALTLARLDLDASTEKT